MDDLNIETGRFKRVIGPKVGYLKIGMAVIPADLILEIVKFSEI
jgi:hypothetical protein